MQLGGYELSQARFMAESPVPANARTGEQLCGASPEGGSDRQEVLTSGPADLRVFTTEVIPAGRHRARPGRVRPEALREGAQVRAQVRSVASW